MVIPARPAWYVGKLPDEKLIIKELGPYTVNFLALAMTRSIFQVMSVCTIIHVFACFCLLLSVSEFTQDQN